MASSFLSPLDVRSETIQWRCTLGSNVREAGCAEGRVCVTLSSPTPKPMSRYGVSWEFTLKLTLLHRVLTGAGQAVRAKAPSPGVVRAPPLHLRSCDPSLAIAATASSRLSKCTSASPVASPWALYSTMILVGFSGAKNWKGGKQKSLVRKKQQNSNAGCYRETQAAKGPLLHLAESETHPCLPSHGAHPAPVSSGQSNS